ncbi:O-antigen ligase [Pseudomonas sp. C27(2019)]|uniref:O-antigen ligase family protein n=1 Tax=Pseudomonas sp. C27(2019) TaxID=2604941 RepID=UPI0015B46D6F|nr:O-antigen ligase family protein [Pseudomonas sp. C27(2019)]
MFPALINRVKEDYFLYALLFFLASFFFLPTSKMVNNVYYAALALPAIFYIIKTRFSDFKININVASWFLLFFILFVSGLLGGVDFQYYKHLLYLFLFMAVCVFFIKGQLLFSNNFYKFSFWLVSFYVLFSTVFYWITGKYGIGERVIWLPARMTGPIYTSMLISALFSVALPVWLKNKNYIEFFVALSLSLFTMSFILQSRTGIVSLLFVLFCYLAYLVYMRNGIRHIAIYIIVSFILFALIYFFSESIPVLDSLIKRADAGRFELWSQLLEDFKGCDKYFGCGPDFQSDRLIKNAYPIVHPHNIFLALLVQTGVLSLLLFLFICVISLYCSYVNKNNWGLYLLSSIVALNFDGSHIVGNPDELWMLILLPIFMIMLGFNQLRKGEV